MVRLMYAIGLGIGRDRRSSCIRLHLLGLIVVFRLIRLPFARVRIDREEGGGLTLIVPQPLLDERDSCGAAIWNHP